MTQRSFDIAARLRSFRYAMAGLWFMLRTQHNAWIHVGVAVAVVASASFLGVRAEDWRWLVVAITLVWFAEAINTAFEHLCDVVSPDIHASVAKAKDVAAGAVLICAVGAAIIGILVFWPYVYKV